MNYILVVDDQADIRRLLSITLGKQYKVIEAETGNQALHATHKYIPALVLLDVMMPGDINGLQVLKAIKSNPKTEGVLVAMVTAMAQQTDRDEAERLGADAYFIKPFSPLQLVQWIRERLA